MKVLMSWHLQIINDMICTPNSTRILILVLPRAYYNISMSDERFFYDLLEPRQFWSNSRIE